MLSQNNSDFTFKSFFLKVKTHTCLTVVTLSYILNMSKVQINFASDTTTTEFAYKEIQLFWNVVSVERLHECDALLQHVCNVAWLRMSHHTVQYQLLMWTRASHYIHVPIWYCPSLHTSTEIVMKCFEEESLVVQFFINWIKGQSQMWMVRKVL
jgi:hypothetical protein